MPRKRKRSGAPVVDDHNSPCRKRICIDRKSVYELAKAVQLECAFSKFPQHTDSLRHLYQSLRTRSWSLVEYDLERCRSVSSIDWKLEALPEDLDDYSLGWPVLIPAQCCWTNGRSPSTKELLEFCESDPTAKSAVIEYNGQCAKDKTMQDVLRQLCSPPPQQTLVAHNIPLEDFATMNAETIPFKHLRPRVENDIDYSMNVTPANTVVDIHVDQGTCGLSIGMGRPTDDPKVQVRKIWFLWPPTRNNLKTYEYLRGSVREKGPCLPRSQELENGLIADIGIDAAILLPPGWLHATVTTNGGFLGGITFNVPSVIAIASKMLAIDLNLSMSSFLLRMPQYCDALREARHAEIGSYASQAAVDYWTCCIEPCLRKNGFKCGSKPIIRECKTLLAVWRSYFPGKGAKAADSRRYQCVGCGWTTDGDTAFGEHFWKTHLKIIMPAGYRSPYHVKRTKSKAHQ